MLKNIPVELFNEAMLYALLGGTMCATNTGCWKLPFKLLSLLPSVNRINSGHFFMTWASS